MTYLSQCMQHFNHLALLQIIIERNEGMYFSLWQTKLRESKSIYRIHL